VKSILLDGNDVDPVDYILRILTEAQAASLGITDGDAPLPVNLAGGEDYWTTIATAVNIALRVEPPGKIPSS